jgi:ABC-type multidrug transport system ATPase subunit
MRTIATLQEADSGTIMLNDINVEKEPRKLREVLGYLPQEFGVYPNITAYGLLDHVAVLKGITNSGERKEMVNYLLNKVNLFDKRSKKVKSFSGGMKQRVGIAQALIGSPQLIIVDEPTAGLDPGERNRFHNLLADVGEDVVVILSTHIVDDVSELCNNMAIMNNGSLVYNGSPITVLDEIKGMVWRKAIDRSELEDHMNNFRVISNKMVAGRPQIHVLSENNPGEGFVGIEPNLEDVFFTKVHFAENANV